MSITQNKHKPLLLPQTPITESNRGGSKKRTRKTGSPFHGVRKRKWGRYVSEIRLPGQKTRIWLGSFDSPEKAARAYDSAAFFVKGNSACLNFPESVGLLPRPQSGSRKDIQSAAAKAAMEMEPSHNRGDSGREDPECLEWWGELETLPFEEVKDCPLLSPRKMEVVGAEYSWSFVEDDELMQSSCCFEL